MDLETNSLQTMYTTMYVRYCTALGNALIHKRRIMDKLLPFGRISIILVADQQSNLSYHRIGMKQNEKTQKILPEIPDRIEFFEAVVVINQ